MDLCIQEGAELPGTLWVQRDIRTYDTNLADAPLTLLFFRAVLRKRATHFIPLGYATMLTATRGSRLHVMQLVSIIADWACRNL
jgi:hypothetical protein